jgi:IS605 OrfB family transposase
VSTPKRLRRFDGKREIGPPTGAAITARLRTSPADDAVCRAVAALVSRYRHRDLAERTRQGEVAGAAKRAALAGRKRGMTAVLSSRWAGAIVHGNDAQHDLAVRGQQAHAESLQAAIDTITARLAVPAGESVLPPGARKPVRGYRDGHERFAKQQRRQHLAATLARLEADRAAGRVHVVEGGRRLLRKGHHLDKAGLTLAQWRAEWERERLWLQANGSPDEPFGNLTITVTPGGRLWMRLPHQLQHLANTPGGRYVFDAHVAFTHRGDQWAARVTPDEAGRCQAVSYRITAHPRSGWILTACWSAPKWEAPATVVAPWRPFGLDLNADHVAGWVADRYGNPISRPQDFPAAFDGLTAGRRDALIGQVVARIVHTALRRGCDAIVVEDLNFVDARRKGRETMGRGRRGKRFRRTVAGMPTGKFRDRLQAAAHRAGLRLIAVNPAYTSAWGEQHWRKPTSTPRHTTTRHQAAGLVIARRAQGHRARRRTGVTRARPEDQAGRATVQAGPEPRARGRLSPGKDARNHLGGPNRGENTRPVGQPLRRQATALTSSGQQHL